MPTKQELKAMEQAESLANANQQFAEEFSGAAQREDVLTPEVKGEIRGLGIGATPGRVTNNANRFVTLYHAYDGRSVPVPTYMGPQRLTERFPAGDTTVPDEFRGKQVWFLRPQKTTSEAYDFQCRLSPNAAEDVREEVRRAGLAATCRKRLAHGGFSTQFEADEHFRVKHPRRWAAYQRFLGIDTQKTAASNMETLVQAMTEMARASAASAPAAAPAKE